MSVGFSNREIHAPDGSAFIRWDMSPRGTGLVRRYEAHFDNRHDATFFRREDARAHVRALKKAVRRTV